MTLEALLNGDRDKIWVEPYKDAFPDSRIPKDGWLNLFFRPECSPFDYPTIAVYDRMDNGEWRLTETARDSSSLIIDSTVYYYIDGRYNRRDTFYNGTLIPSWNRQNAPENVHRVYEEATT